MYGIVNQAIEDLVVAHHGAATWERILERAGRPDLVLHEMDSYPDELTFELVGATAEELEVPVPELLRLFGRTWITYTSDRGFGRIIAVAGDSFGAFLSGLDSMHERVTSTFRSMEPPRMVLREAGDDRFVLEYHSRRAGLEPMVVGLLEGLAERFHLEAEVSFEPGEGFVAFTIRTRPAAVRHTA
jgi:hypothetical protein